MMKYYNMEMVFQEIPDEISLAINITNCPNLCEGCHSPHLREDIGDELTIDAISENMNEHITCILFMGGDGDLKGLKDILKKVKDEYPYIKTAWYSGRCKIPTKDMPFDYFKLGGYIKELGGLDNPNTNQCLIKVDVDENGFRILNDITAMMQKKWKKNEVQI